MAETRLHIRMSEQEREMIKKLADEHNMTETEYIIYRTLTINPENPENKEKEFIYETPSMNDALYFLATTIAETRITMSEDLKQEYGDEWDDFTNMAKDKTRKFLNKCGFRKIRNPEKVK